MPVIATQPVECVETPSTLTLEQARAEFVREVKQGTTCKCCGRGAKVTTRRLTKAMVDCLRRMDAAGPDVWVAARDLGMRGGDYGKLRYWGFVNHKKTLWQVTPRGRDFLHNGLHVQSQIDVFNGEPVGVAYGVLVSIKDFPA